MAFCGGTGLLSGCTPDKADALLTAVKGFASSSNDALTAYENLFKDYRFIQQPSAEEDFRQAYAAIAKHGAQSVTFEQTVSNLSSLSPQGSSNSPIENEFSRLRSTYDLLARAYASLPQGSILGARYVPCGQLAVSKLTKQLVTFSSDLNSSPLYPNTLRQDFAAFKVLAKKGDAGGAQQKFEDFRLGLLAYETRHKEAIARTLIAVEQGRRLNQLLSQYSSVSLANLLGVVQYGFSIAGTLQGASTASAATQLQSIRNQMDLSDYWKRVESISLDSISDCPVQPR